VARRKVVTSLLLATGSLIGAIAYRRRFSNRRARVDLYYEDGSMISVGEGSPEGDKLLPLARDVLRASRG